MQASITPRNIPLTSSSIEGLSETEQCIRIFIDVLRENQHFHDQELWV